MQAGDLHVRLMADIAQFQRQMAQANSIVAQTARQMEASLVSIASRVAGPLALIFATKQMVTWTNQAINAADQAGKLAQTIGVATEQVAGLQLAFRQSGLQAEQLAPIMSKLAAATANGNKALEAMNVATRNADGSLRSTRQVLGDVADRFAGYADGASKTALAVALLGEEGAKLVPLLNGGAAGLSDMDAKAKALGLTLDADAARAAARFNDELDLFKARLEGAAQTIATKLLPTLNRLIGQLNDGAAAYGSFWDATIDIGLNVDPFKSLNDNLAATIQQINTYKAIIDELNARTGPDLFGRRAAQVEKYQQALERAVARERYLLQQLKAEGGRSGNPLAALTGGAQAPVIGAGVDKLGDFITTQLAAQRQRALDAMVKAQADATKAIIEDMDRQAKAADALARAEEEWVARGRKAREDAAKASADSTVQRLAELQDEERAIALAAQQNVSLAEAVELVAIQRLYEQSVGLDANDPRAAAIDREIQAREKLIELMRSRATREANQQAAEQAARDWAQVTQQIGQSLTDALMNGSMKAGDFIKNLFKTMVLRPVIQAVMNPVMGAIGGTLGMAGTAAASTGGAAGGAMNAAGMMASVAGYGGLFGAGATMALTGGTSAALSAAGAAMSAGSVGGGLAIGAGALAPWVIGGMVLLQGLSRKLKDVGVQGTFGGDAGFTGEQYRFYKGGFLRSDKTSTSALDAEMQNLLSGSFLQIRESTATMARELGLSADALDGFTKDIKLSLKGLTEEQIQQKLAQEFGALGDEMARLVAGSGATRQSLEQLYQSVMSQREQLEVRLLELQGNTVALRERERAAIFETNRGLYDRIIALQDERAALDAMMASAVASATKEVQKQISASMAAANAARAAAQAYSDAGQTLQSTIASLSASSAKGPSAEAAYRAGLASALTGDAQAMTDLSGLATTYAESVKSQARTATEARIAQARIASELAGVAALSASLAEQEQARATLLDINTATLKVLQEDLQNGDLTIEALQEHTRLLEAIGQALSETSPIAGLLNLLYEITLNGFDALDTTTDGLLTLDELKTGLAGIATDEQLKALIDSVDTNGDGAISQLELAVAAIGTMETNLVAKLATEFAALDTTADGLLTLDELKTGLAGIATDEQLKALIDSVDTNGDGQVSELELATKLLNAVGEGTYGLLDEQGQASSLLSSSDTTLSRVLAKLSEENPQTSQLIANISAGNTLIAGRLDTVILAINQQTAAQQAEAKRQQDIERAQAELKSSKAYLDSLQNAVNAAVSIVEGTAATVRVKVGSRPAGLFGWDRKGIYEDQTNPAYTEASNALKAAQDALNAFAPQVTALRDLITSLGGVPGFATGGLHTGGLRLVGEQGPELEVTGPARYWSAADTMSMLGNSSRREEVLVAEIRALRTEVANLRAEARATAENTGKTKRLMERVTRDGESLLVTDVTPAP